jgi:hypothetical protein
MVKLIWLGLKDGYWDGRVVGGQFSHVWVKFVYDESDGCFDGDALRIVILRVPLLLKCKSNYIFVYLLSIFSLTDGVGLDPAQMLWQAS